MNRLDKDIELAKQQLSSVLAIARDEGISPAQFVARRGFDIPLEKDFPGSDRIKFIMKPNYDKYGKDTVYYFNIWTEQLVMLLGVYSDEDFRSTSHVGLRNNYENFERNNFVYLSWTPRHGIEVLNSIQKDSWGGYSYNILYGYSVKSTMSFMNWKKSPF